MYHSGATGQRNRDAHRRPTSQPRRKQADILDQLLHLQGATVLELGGGKADKTRIVANKVAVVLALEMDERQLAKNLEITDLPNVRFAHGGAEKIPADDSSFDIVLMFKSLHHVPIELMDSVFSEIWRVLNPGGVAYISEPVYAGDTFHMPRHTDLLTKLLEID